MTKKSQLLVSVLSSWLVMLGVGSVGSAVAQTSPSTGAIEGVVEDPQGAVVGGARVTLTNLILGAKRETKSEADGTFIFPFVQPGSGYEVAVQQPGFQRAAAKDLSIYVTQVTTANLKLALGSLTTEVVVTSAPETVQTSNATLGDTLPNQVVTSLPLPTRNVLDLLATDAGVVAVLTSPAATVLQGSEAMFVGGARDTANNYMVNGVDANNFEFHTLAVGVVPVPNPDAVQEFRTETSLYDATSGFSGGGNIALITRSGTSQYHGNLFEYIRNSVLNANDFFFNRNGTPKPFLIQNQFGGSVGGPIPHTQKTFWFFNYEGTRQRNGITGAISGQMPVLPAQRTAASLAALYNVPVSAIDPVAINILNAPGPYGGLLYPSGTGSPPGELGNFSFSSPAHITGDQYNGRVDHDFRMGRVQNSVGVSYFASPATFINPGGANGLLGQPYEYLLRNDTLAIHDTQTIRSNLLNEITVGFTYNKRDIAAIKPLSIAAIGMSRFNSSLLAGTPFLVFTDQLSCCGASASVGLTQHNESQDFRDIVSYVRGRHEIRTGFEARTQQFNNGCPLNPGTLSFAPSFADMMFGPPLDPLADLSIRDFLIGAPLSISISSGLVDFGYRAHDFGAFVQDDYRVTPRLTLNLGLRWDYLGNITEVHNLISNFDPSLLSPATAQLGGSGLQAGFILPSRVPKFGTPAVSKSTLLDQDKSNFAPRVGFAYRLLASGKGVVRGGYGIYYMRIGGLRPLQTILNPPLALSIAEAGTKTQILANPFPVLPLPNQFPQFPPFPVLTSFNPDGSANFSPPQLSIASLDRREHTPYMEQWNLAFQYEFLPGWSVELGYLGTRGLKLQNAQELNNALLHNASNPGPFGLITNSSANREARVPVVGINSFGLFALTGNAKSFYDGLLLTVSHQFTHGLFFKGAYTFSKSIDNTPAFIGFEPGIGASGNQFLPDLNKGLSNFDVRHRLVVTYLYDLPSPHEGVLKHVLGRWAISGLTVYQSGFANEVDQSLSGNSFSGTDGYGVLDPGCQLTSGGSVSSHVDDYLNSSCASTTPVLNGGATFGPLSPFEGPGNQTYVVTPGGLGQLQGRSTRGAFRNPFQTRWDAALTKTIRVPRFGESGNIQFRAEAFKLFNTPIFGGPDNLVGTSGFGKITTTIDNTGRQLQFALRVNF